MWDKSSKDSDDHDGLRGQINAIQGHHRGWSREQGILYISLFDSQENGGGHFMMNLKPLNHFITCTKFKTTILKQIREAIHPGQWGISLHIKPAYCDIPIARIHHCILHFRLRGKVYQFRSLTLGLCTAPKTFTRALKTILLLCQKMGNSVIYTWMML